MKAMILAAGLGTRLLPLTDTRPKALVEVSGKTLLELVVQRLRKFGVDEIIVNVHHFADMVSQYLDTHGHFGMRIEVSREETLLDTGGGLKKAGWFFLNDRQDPDEPFILHNVDVISTIDLGQMLHFHQKHEALVTLAVRKPTTSRCLLFEESGQLCGHSTGQHTRRVRSSDYTAALDFTGVHVISPRLLPMMREEGAFSIIDTYLRLASEDQKILAFNADTYSWEDAGHPEGLERTRNRGH